MAVSKVRFLTDTLMIGQKINKMYGTNPSCICGYPVETRFHILLDCLKYIELREFYQKQIIDIMAKFHPTVPVSVLMDRTVLTHLILDPSWYRFDIGSTTKGMPNILTLETANKIEIIGRTFCFQVYKLRFNLLSEIETDSDNETVCEDSFSLHDTSSEDNSETEGSDLEISS